MSHGQAQRTHLAGPATLDFLEPGFRVNSPVVRAAAERHWYAETALGPAILRYDDCVAIRKLPGMIQAAADHLALQGITEGPVAEMWSRMVLNIEGPDHVRLRRLVTPAFTPARVEALRVRMREIAGALVDRFAPTGRCEFMADFADLYPPGVFFEMLGIPAEEHPRFLEWGKAIADMLSYEVPRRHDRIAAALAGVAEASRRLCQERRRRPGDDLLSALVAACDGEDRLSQDEIDAMVAVLVLGGQDSTRCQLGLGMVTFSGHPKQWALLGEQPELTRAAVEEVLRVNSVVPIMWRVAEADVDYRDLHLSAGTRIWMMTGLTHLESHTFGEDAPFDITATDRRAHLSFGHGTHYCLGARLARVEMAEALPILARRLPDLALDGDGDFRPDLAGFVGPERLPLRFTPSAA